MSDVEDLIYAYGLGKLSRSNFVRRLLALGVGMGFIETLLGQGAHSALAASQAVPSRAPYFVLVVMDAFRADYRQLAPMPNLEWLMRVGTTFDQAWVGQLESYTPSSHATISTGAMPAHSGVIGFSWRDPNSGQEVLAGWYKSVIAGRLEKQLTDHGVNSIPLALKKSDPTARVIAVSGEKYYAADAMGGAAADYIIYGHPQGKKILTKGIPHHVPPHSFLKKPSLTKPWPLHYGEFDQFAMTMALESLRSFDPRALMINLPGPDIYGHQVGGPATPEVMTKLVAGCDQQLGRLLRAYRDRGILDQTIFVVTADHGMVKNTYQIDDNEIKWWVGKSGGDYLFHSGGNSAFIWLKKPHKAPQVARGLVNNLKHAPLAHYQTIESGKYVYHPVTRTGWTLDPALENAHQYLLSTFAGAIAPDISLTFEENTITRLYPKAHGEHGGTTWGAQQIPMVIAGPGVRKGAQSSFPARLMDIAPTVLTLLGVQPTNMDGVTLADALNSPTKAQQTSQDAIAGALTAFQNSIIARSHTDQAIQEPVPGG